MPRRKRKGSFKQRVWKAIKRRPVPEKKISKGLFTNQDVTVAGNGASAVVKIFLLFPQTQGVENDEIIGNRIRHISTKIRLATKLINTADDAKTDCICRYNIMVVRWDTQMLSSTPHSLSSILGDPTPLIDDQRVPQSVAGGTSVGTFYKILYWKTGHIGDVGLETQNLTSDMTTVSLRVPKKCDPHVAFYPVHRVHTINIKKQWIAESTDAAWSNGRGLHVMYVWAHEVHGDFANTVVRVNAKVLVKWYDN